MSGSAKFEIDLDRLKSEAKKTSQYDVFTILIHAALWAGLVYTITWFPNKGHLTFLPISAAIIFIIARISLQYLRKTPEERLLELFERAYSSDQKSIDTKELIRILTSEIKKQDHWFFGYVGSFIVIICVLIGQAQ